MNSRDMKVLCSNVIIADKFLTRLRGLLFKDILSFEMGILIKPCNRIHTFWMRFPIDVIFLSKENVILHMIENFDAGNISPAIKHADAVFELASGAIKEANIKLGDILFFQ